MIPAFVIYNKKLGGFMRDSEVVKKLNRADIFTEFIECKVKIDYLCENFQDKEFFSKEHFTVRKITMKLEK